MLFLGAYSYEVLSDSDKRRVYDTRGEAGLNESGGMGGMDPQVRSAYMLITWREHPY
jgi:DnaJ-class molecular chaperone